ncbi:hypothetical protein M0805_002568 [Coniferiporia weirii]|nr:hypothetical protein M0805_002568 [Coniferiporia weirii]
MTASDLPGPGRLLGRLYSAGGRAVERHLNKAGRVLGIAPRPDFPAPVYDEGNEEIGFNLPGAGRTLDLAYSFTGRSLEKRLNEIALRLGKGPDAALKRMQARALPYYRLEDQRTFLFLQSLQENGKTVTDCKRLLKYARSDVLENRRQALQHIITLSSRDPFYSTILINLGAVDVLRQYASDCPLTSDPFSKQSQEALISLSATRIHSLGKKLIDSERRKDAALDLLDHIQDPETSFLALRHLAQVSTYLLDSDVFFEKFAVFLWRLDISSSTYEWETLDTLCCSVINKTGDILTFEYLYATKCLFVSKYIPAFVMSFLRLAEKIPKTASRLTGFIPWKIALFMATEPWFPVAVYRAAISSCVKNLENCHIPPSRALTKIVAAVSSDVELAVSYMIKEQFLHMRNARLEMRFVIDNHLLDSYCEMIVGALVNSPKTSAVHLLQCLPVIRSLDRYCWGALKRHLTKVGTTEDTAEVLYALHDLDMAPLPDFFRFSTNDFWLNRIYLPETGRHHYCQLSPVPIKGAVPYRTALQEKRWWPPLPTHLLEHPADRPATERLLTTYCGCLLLLDIPPGKSFTRANHYPLLAGYDEHGEEEYIAAICEEEGLPGFCTVHDGDVTAEFWDEKGDVRTAEHFQVFVMRFDMDDFGTEVMDEVKGDSGVDYTGPMYWKDLQIQM